MTRKSLPLCGIIAMLWYVAMNIIVPMRYPGYDSASQTVSELSAIQTPTRTFWFILCIFYSLLFLAFGYGILLSANKNRKLRIVAIIIMVDALIGIYWPPMHQKEVIAAGGGTLTDTLHLVWAFVHLLLMLLMIGFGAAVFGKGFRVFSAIVVLIFFVFGILTTIESRGIEAGLPTPYIGIWERINIAAYMLWVIVFAILLIRRNNTYPQQRVLINS
ncbi:hypothetical protein CAP36_01060 [Chitinophagaceae bacterium IBVUCB2]|nr:hypothetical protein CAP36_01060 [Chitinophagaceae bacterium IBVUCB2]